jgi:hypothetical protein
MVGMERSDPLNLSPALFNDLERVEQIVLMSRIKLAAGALLIR